MTPVFGIFFDRHLAEQSVERLRALTFQHGEVTLLDPADLGSKDLSHDRHAKAGGSTAVVIIGVAIGGIAGLLTGLLVQGIPAIGDALSAAPILGALIGFGLGGMVGGAIDAIDADGPPGVNAGLYEGKIQEGGILVTVHCETPAQFLAATRLLTETGAQAVSGSAESTSSIHT